MANTNVGQLPVAVSITSTWWTIVEDVNNGGTTSRAQISQFGSGSGGGVSSVGLALPASVFSVSGSPVTDSGTLHGDFIAQAANTVFAGPVSGGSATPTFRALTNGDISGVGAALTRTNDTNVTLTLGGSPSTALVNAASLTLSWTGLLGLARGGTNADLSATGGTSQVLKQVTSGGNITVGQLAASDLSNGVTGSGAVVLATSPSLITPALGTPSSGNLANCTGFPAGSLSGQVALANGGTGSNLSNPGADKILYWDNTGGDVTWLAIGANLSITSNTLNATGGGGGTNIAIGSTVITGGSTGRVLYDNAGVAGEYPITGTAGSVVLSVSPAFTGTPTIAGSSTGTTGLQASATASGTLTLPAATDTLIGKATTDTLTNKTYDTAGTGNSFKINGTAITAVTGTGSVVLATSPTLVTPLLGTPTSGNLANCTGYPTGSLSGLGTGVATALAINVGTAGAIVVNGGVLGTPSSGTLSACTGLPISTGVSGLGTGVATFLGTPSSANLAAAITDETGTGALVFATSPSLVTPILGTPTSGNLSNCTGYPAGSLSGQVALANGGTSANLTASNGGIFYSTASAAAILAGTATAGQIIRSGSSTAPTWSTSTFPATSAAGTILASLTANTITASATPVLGASGTTGTLGFAGTSSGVVTVQPQSAAGTYNFNLPTSAGTSGLPLVSAGGGSSPQTYSALAAVALAGSAFSGSSTMVNGTIVASVSSNILTVAIKTLAGTDPSSTDPVYFFFRNATAATGDYTVITVTAALNMTINATGATLGTANTTPFRLWLTAFNNAGTVVLALWQSVTGGASPTGLAPLNEAAVASTTGISGTATAAGTFYTPNGTSLTGKAFRVLGYLEYGSGLTTAGTYASGPTTIQLFGPGIRKPGDIIQEAIQQTGAVSTGSTIMPFDDTIPQNTEGDQYMSQSLTPVFAGNVLIVNCIANVAGSTLGNANVALFQDSGANALAASTVTVPAANYTETIPIGYRGIAGTTSSTTFKIRIGPSSAFTITFNGQAGGRIFGGVMGSILRVTEIMV